MIINIANFNFDGGSGGGGKPALLQEKTATIVQNGSQTIVPDEGFDGMSSVQINAAITGASSAIDFSIIGYDAELSADLNAKFNDDVAYSKTLLDDWNPSNTSATSLYSGDTKLVYAPNIDTSNVNRMNNMFADCSRLTTVVDFNTSNVTNMSYMFSDCSRLTSVPDFNTSNVTNMDHMLYGCSSLTSVPYFDTSNVTNLNFMFNGCTGITTIPAFNTSNVTSLKSTFAYCSSLTSLPYFDTSNVTNMTSVFQTCSSLKKIEGFSVKKIGSMKYYHLFGYESNSSVRKILIKDVGTNTNMTEFNMSYATNWGINTDEIPDARQSVIDSLITYSFDRFSAGYPTCSITLSANTKALLTADEIAQIETKGFVIA